MPDNPNDIANWGGKDDQDDGSVKAVKEQKKAQEKEKANLKQIHKTGNGVLIGVGAAFAAGATGALVSSVRKVRAEKKEWDAVGGRKEYNRIKAERQRYEDAKSTSPYISFEPGTREKVIAEYEAKHGINQENPFTEKEEAPKGSDITGEEVAATHDASLSKTLTGPGEGIQSFPSLPGEDHMDPNHFSSENEKAEEDPAKELEDLKDMEDLEKL